MLQDSDGTYYLLSSKGFLVPMNERGTKPGEPIKLDLGDHKVAYSGFSFSAPRTGTVQRDVLDIVFTDQNAGSWLYLEVKLPPKPPAIPHPVVHKQKDDWHSRTSRPYMF